jgi:hypothetical protein
MRAAAVGRKSRFNLAWALLLVGACRHYVWPLFPPEARGWVAKGLGAFAIMCLLAVVWQIASVWTKAVIAWWAVEESQVFGWEIGLVGLVVVALLALVIPVNNDSVG